VDQPTGRKWHSLCWPAGDASIRNRRPPRSPPSRQWSGSRAGSGCQAPGKPHAPWPWMGVKGPATPQRRGWPGCTHAAGSRSALAGSAPSSMRRSTTVDGCAATLRSDTAYTIADMSPSKLTLVDRARADPCRGAVLPSAVGSGQKDGRRDKTAAAGDAAWNQCPIHNAPYAMLNAQWADWWHRGGGGSVCRRVHGRGRAAVVCFRYQSWPRECHARPAELPAAMDRT
jgi:hypothetical protein